MIDEGDCGAIGGMKIGRGNRRILHNTPVSARNQIKKEIYIITSKSLHTHLRE
jgi:hypothetical protein